MASVTAILLPGMYASTSRAQEVHDQPPAAIQVPLFAKAPQIDGRIDNQEWRGAHGFDGFIQSGGAHGGWLEHRRARVWLGATEDTLFVAIATQLPDEGELLAKVARDSLKLVHDDAVEVFVNPTPDAVDQVDYQFVANSLGHSAYTINKKGDPAENEAWTGDWHQAQGRHDGWWHCEVAIPIQSMSMVEPGRRTTDGMWNLNVARDWKPDWGWSSLTGAYAHGGRRVVFTDAPAPSVQTRFEGHPAWTPHRQVLSLYNPSNVPVNVDAELKLVRNRMPALDDKKTLTLAPGEERELAIELGENDPTTVFELSARVTNAADDTLYYERELKWRRAEHFPRWIVGRAKDAPPFNVQFAYYPSHNKMRLTVDITGLPDDAKLEQVTAVIRDHWSGEDIKIVNFPLPNFVKGRQDIQIELPPLAGDYDIVTTVKGENTPDKAVVKHFERTVFPWENNPIGKSTTVYPPFTPMSMQGAILNTVLRKHALNAIGLLDQVVASSANTGIAKPVLAAPMRYTARINDAVVTTPNAQPLSIVSVQEHEVVTEARFSLDPLKLTAKQIWDYDGTVKVELTLLPAPNTIDSLTLEIPFSRESAPLIHANADRIRAPIAKRLPEGDGVVWDAGQVASDEMTRNFCPYIYLGSAVRGLCWFAENDLNWGWNPDTPNLDVVRQDDQVILRIHLINRPTIIDEPRTITFGLLAAPVKPPLNLEPRNPNWWRLRYFRDRYTLLGTDINWFGNGSCGAVYPVNKDLYLWEMLARGNREKMDWAEIDDFTAYGDKHWQGYGEKWLRAWRNHARLNLRSRYGKKMIFYYNRAASQELPEFETFKDEWTLTDRRTIGKGQKRNEIKIVPSRSFIDFHLYWYARSFEIGANRGVYWDNWFIAPTFNTEMTAAYQREDGSVVPAAGIWAHRELAKRTFVMMNERDMPPITFAHMTSFSPLPMLSFATVQFDWEWKYSQGDVQNRFTREFILLTGTGELAGVWPVPLEDHGALADDPWIQRTFSAVRILHELDGYGGWGGAGKVKPEIRQALADPILAMLDKPNLTVYKYWEDRVQPVVTTNADVPTIVYSVPESETLVAVVSYSTKDETVTVQANLKALGLDSDCSVTDVESGNAIAIRNGTFDLSIKTHDIRLLRLAEKGKK